MCMAMCGRKRPHVHLIDYYNASHAVDDHNNKRQGQKSGLGLEYAWPTESWVSRCQVCLIGVCVVDAYLAFRHFSKARDTFLCIIFSIAP